MLLSIIGWEFSDKWKRNLYCKSISPPTAWGLFGKFCQISKHVCIALLEHATLQTAHYQFCCEINGAIDQWQTCVSCRMADQSPTAEPDIRAAINRTTARMIADMVSLSCSRCDGCPHILEHADMSRGGGCGRFNTGGGENRRNTITVKKRGVVSGTWFQIENSCLVTLI